MLQALTTMEGARSIRIPLPFRRRGPRPPVAGATPPSADRGQEAWRRELFDQVVEGGQYWTGAPSPLYAVEVLRTGQERGDDVDRTVGAPAPAVRYVVLSSDGGPVHWDTELASFDAEVVYAERWDRMLNGRPVLAWSGWVNVESRCRLAEL